MANLSFDFNKVKRSFMTVTLKDNRKLIVKMPMKKTFEKLSALQEMDTDSMTAEDAMDTLGGLCAEILSHNMTGEQVTAKEITDDYDTEEMEALIECGTDYMQGFYFRKGELVPPEPCPEAMEALRKAVERKKEKSLF